MVKQYTDKQKSNMLAKYYEIRKSGTNAEKAAKAVGVHYNTILKWENKVGKPKVTNIAGKTKPTKTESKTMAPRRNANQKKGRKRTAPATMKTGDIVLVTPDGFRIEGIAPQDLVRVLRELK